VSFREISRVAKPTAKIAKIELVATAAVAGTPGLGEAVGAGVFVGS